MESREVKIRCEKGREREVEELGHVAVRRTNGWKEERYFARATANSRRNLTKRESDICFPSYYSQCGLDTLKGS